MMPLALLLASYLLGAVPTALLAGKWTRGIDLREHGSGNLGATNAFRVLGWKTALPVFLFDVFKGWLPVFLFPMIDGAAAGWALAYGAAAIVGHVFSLYVRFKGGKGVATSAGVFLGLAPAALLVGLAVWILAVALTRYVSLGSILAALTVPVMVFLTAGPGPVFGLSLGLGLFVIYAHRANLRRLLQGTESRFGGRRPGEVG